MSSTDDITDEALRPILAPGERPLYRGAGWGTMREPPSRVPSSTGMVPALRLVLGYTHWISKPPVALGL